MFVSLSCFLLSDCAYNPVTGKKELSFMSDEKEIAIGKDSDPKIIAAYGLYEDETLQAFINKKGKEMAAISHRPNLNYQFRILDSPVINAFALPGGYVYFTRGILAHFSNEAEFAGVLGHEIGHITARHSAKQYTRQILGQVGLVAGLLLSDVVRQNANQASQALQLVFLKFGRDQESQSDKLGVQYSSTIGYDARYMADFFNTLNRMRGDDAANMPTFLSTHPAPLDRYKTVNSLAEKFQAENTDKTYAENRDQYLRMIDGLTYGEDPRQGYVENGVFYHPDLKFQFSIPSGWKLANSPQQVQITPENGEAAILMMLAQEKNLDEAGKNFVTNNKLTLVSSQKTSVNGLNAVKIISDQYPQQQQQQQQASSSAAGGQNQSMASNKGQTKGQPKGQNAPQTQNKGQVQSKGQPQGGVQGKTPGKNPSTPNKAPHPAPKGQNQTPIPGKGSNQNPGQGHPAPTQNGVTPTLRIQTTMIEYNGMIYAFHGLTKYAEFNQYSRNFDIPGKNFKKLTNAAKINVKPTKLRVKTVQRTGTLSSTLKALGAKNDQLDELAIINGMKLEDQVKKGSLIKILGK